MAKKDGSTATTETAATTAAPAPAPTPALANDGVGVQVGDKINYVDGNGMVIPAKVTFVFNVGEDETHPNVHLAELNEKGKPTGTVRQHVVHETRHPAGANCWK